MDYKYLDQTQGAYQNYYSDQKQQPATQTAAYSQDTGYGGDANTGGWDQNQADYNYQYQNPGAQTQYQTQNYASESAEPSLSDYNSHESCIRITTKK
jgi:hypothetical protein